jgi:hypothetical protein
MAAKRGHTRGASKRGRFWIKHLHQWLRSGLSQAEYCRRHHLSAPALNWWKRQVPRELWADTPAGLPESNPEAFVELPIGQGPEVSYEITLHGGRLLRLGPRFDLGQVRQLVQVLEQAC